MLRKPLLLLCALPLVAAYQQADKAEPTCDQVFKNIVVFKGVPAKDLIPSMEFMAASLKLECTGCHQADDYSVETRMKETARRMVLMQREINAKHFNNRLSVTCMSCHNGREHPLTAPIPEGTVLRHGRPTTTVKPEELFKKHIEAVGKEPVVLTRSGLLTSPTGDGGKDATSAVELVQASGGRYFMTSSMGKSGSDGKQVWRNGAVLTDEPAAIFGRMGRAWRGDAAFAGLDRVSVSGQEAVGKTATTVVRGTRTATGSTEELYFGDKTGLLVRFVSLTRSTLGTVVTVFDYSDYRSVKGVKVPMKVVITFAGGEKFTMAFKSASVGDKADDKLFAPG